jgi:hypothetical protein
MHVLTTIRSTLDGLGVLGLVAWLGLGLAACNQSEFDDIRGELADNDDSHGDDDRPGNNARNTDEDVSCESQDDCLGGEICLEGVCQMQRCHEGPYVSAPPLAAGLKFFRDHELLVADRSPSDGAYYVDGYAPRTGGVDYPGSWNMGEQEIVDVAGGDFYGQNPERFAVAQQGSTRLSIGGVDGDISLDVGFTPIAIAAGDVDGDDMDEVIAVGQFGNYALCHVDERRCVTGHFQNGNARDVAIGDVDQDGVAEAVLLLEQGGNALLYVLQFDDDDDFYSAANHDLQRIDVGDPDGDGTAEIYGIEAGGWFSSATMFAYSAAGGEVVEIASQDIDDGTRDLAFADFDGDDKDELVLLRESSMVEVFRSSGGSHRLDALFTHQLQVTTQAASIAAADFDGDSPRTRLVDDEPQLVPGPLLPSIVAYFPPYDSQFTDGTPTLILGDTETTTETYTDSVSLSMSIDVGVSASLFDIFKAGVRSRISRAVTRTYGETYSQTIGRRMVVSPDPKTQGQSYGVVGLTCGCFHVYRYRMEDPGALLGDGGDGEEFVMVIPVAGTTTMWSTKRYNAMAEAIGNLPIIPKPSHTIGVVSSYPSGPQKPDGAPIPADDMVFREVPSFLVSDVAQIGFWLSAGETTMNMTAVQTDFSIGAELGLGPFSFGTDVGLGFGRSYSLAVGNEALFGGTVPALADDPATPEDEYLQNAYSFAAYVYREHYEGPEGDDRAYYVLDYAAVRP